MIIEKHLSEIKWDGLVSPIPVALIFKSLLTLTYEHDKKKLDFAFEVLLGSVSYQAIQYESTVTVAQLLIKLLTDPSYRRKKWVLDMLAHIHTYPMDDILLSRIYEVIYSGFQEYQYYLSYHHPSFRNAAIRILGNLRNHASLSILLLCEQAEKETDLENLATIFLEIAKLTDSYNSISKIELEKIHDFLTAYLRFGHPLIDCYAACAYISIYKHETPDPVFSILIDFLTQIKRTTRLSYRIISEISYTLTSLNSDIGRKWLIAAVKSTTSPPAVSFLADALISHAFDFNVNVIRPERLIVFTPQQKEIIFAILENPSYWNKSAESLNSYRLETSRRNLLRQISAFNMYTL